MSSFNAFADPLPLLSRLYELSEEETDWILELYKLVGDAPFTYRELDSITGGRSSLKRLAYVGYVRRHGVWKDHAPKYWVFTQEIRSRFEEAQFVDFEPYKYEVPPYTRWKAKKSYVEKLGMTLDQGWYYCRVRYDKRFEYIMCKVTHMSRKRRDVPAYKVDWERCEKWLSTKK